MVKVARQIISWTSISIGGRGNGRVHNDKSSGDCREPRNILVIGGSGFLSGTIARSAVAAGHRTWVVTRGQRPVPEGVTSLIADRHDRDAFAAVVAAENTHWDAVIDCIAYEPEDMRQNLDVLSTLASQLVFISTDFVFDPTRRSFPQPVEAPYTELDDYGGKKRQCELLLLDGDTGAMEWTILRPCHIYGPGSQLGCLPLHGRDPDLIRRIQLGETLRLVGGGHFLQQPIFVRDLAAIALSAIGNSRAFGQIYCTAGPDIIESRRYYEIVGEVLGLQVSIEEVPVTQALADDPTRLPFYCHRIYSLDRFAEHGLHVPAVPIEDGLREHTESLLAAASTQQN